MLIRMPLLSKHLLVICYEYENNVINNFRVNNDYTKPVPYFVLEN